MTEQRKIPPLPKPSKLRRQIRRDGGYDMVPAYTVEEMEAYAQACLAAQPAPQRVAVPDVDWLANVIMEADKGHAAMPPRYLAQTIIAAMKAAAPQPDGVGYVNAIMEKVQEFASAWALVGTRFDDGDGFEHAEAIKTELRALLAKGNP